VLSAHTRSGSGQLVEKGLGLLQVQGIESFREPVVDRCEQVAGLLLVALLVPQEGEAPSSTVI